MKTAIAILIGVLALIVVLDGYVAYVSWPLSGTESLSILYGPKYDVEFQVPPSMYKAWFKEAYPIEQSEVCKYFIQAIGITLDAGGQQYRGRACSHHMMTLASGAEQFQFKMPKEFWTTCYRLNGLNGRALRPNPTITKKIFPAEIFSLADSVYSLVQGQMRAFGAPVTIQLHKDNRLIVGFDYKYRDWQPMRIHYEVDIESGNVKSLKRAWCGTNK